MSQVFRVAAGHQDDSRAGHASGPVLVGPTFSAASSSGRNSQLSCFAMLVERMLPVVQNVVEHMQADGIRV